MTRPDPTYRDSPNADYVRVIGKCNTRYDHNDGEVSFTVVCYLDEGHTGSHRGVARIDFAPLLVPPAAPWPPKYDPDLGR